jgi:hypothetical protein
MKNNHPHTAANAAKKTNAETVPELVPALLTFTASLISLETMVVRLLGPLACAVVRQHKQIRENPCQFALGPSRRLGCGLPFLRPNTEQIPNNLRELAENTDFRTRLVGPSQHRTFKNALVTETLIKLDVKNPTADEFLFKH